MLWHSLVNTFYIAVIAIVTTVPIQNTVCNENALSFTWYDGVVPEDVKIMDANRLPHPPKHLAETSQLYKDINGTFKLGATDFSAEFPDSIAWTKTGGFVDTVFFGYQQHHNVIIRPDDIWTAIIIQFSLYVNANAEALRHSFVNFEGKNDLKVEFRSRIDRVPIDEFIRKIMALIHENIDRTNYDWISPNFTTTTTNDKLTNGVAMMATLQKYFDYELWGIICGIPEATVLGTLDDWMDIRERVKRLTQFELEGKNVMAQWSHMLGLIIDEFVSVKKNNKPDTEFWKQAIRIDYKVHDFVCAKINETSINGWITAFSAFDLGGQWRGGDKIVVTQSPWLKVRTDKITPGIVHVPIRIYDEFAEESERNYVAAIITGHMGYSVKMDGVTLQPLAGWIMTITNGVPQYMKRNRNVN